FPRHLADPPGGLDIVQLERLAYWATLSRQPKDDQDICKRFLFHYSRNQEPTHPVKTGPGPRRSAVQPDSHASLLQFRPVHPLMRLAAKLANRRMKRFRQRDSGAAAADFTKKDHTAMLGRPFFLFRV
ncbi:Neuromedin-S, partial [Camelus dromedarius]